MKGDGMISLLIVDEADGKRYGEAVMGISESMMGKRGVCIKMGSTAGNETFHCLAGTLKLARGYVMPKCFLS